MILDTGRLEMPQVILGELHIKVKFLLLIQQFQVKDIDNQAKDTGKNKRLLIINLKNSIENSFNTYNNNKKKLKKSL